MEIELRQLFRYARRWWWVLLLLPVAAGATSYAISSRQQPLYSATATLMINPAPGSTTGDINTVNAAQRLATTYQQLVVTQPVLQPVIETLQLPYRVDELQDKVSASAPRDTQLLKVSVSDTDPETAAIIANTVAAEFAKFISTQAIGSASSSRAALQQMIDDNDQQREETRQQIAALEAKSDPTAQERADLESAQSRAGQLDETRADLLLRVAEMDLSAAAVQEQVSETVPATAPDSPYAPRILFNSLLAAFVGLLLAVGAVALIEYLDNTVKAGLDLSALIGAPLLGAVGSVPKLRGGSDQLFMTGRPKSTAAEAIRLLRTNIEFSAATKEITTLAVTSPGPGEGKSTVTANLAVAMVQSGVSAVVVDADLRRPSQHRIFNVRNERGLTTLLTHPKQPWRWAAVDIMPGLCLIPSGPIPPNPADLLSLIQLRLLLDEIAKSTDVVIIDTPPVLAVSDPLVVATNVDAVLLVSRAGRTRIDALRRAAASLQHGATRIVGVVLNHQSGRGADGYYYYYEDYYG
ncbi:MAG: polysaccharide biosynthesis tyrosine autokinase, partial [Thermomicrobiales bacterium]